MSYNTCVNRLGKSSQDQQKAFRIHIHCARTSELQSTQLYPVPIYLIQGDVLSLPEISVDERIGFLLVLTKKGVSQIKLGIRATLLSQELKVGPFKLMGQHFKLKKRLQLLLPHMGDNNQNDVLEQSSQIHITEEDILYPPIHHQSRKRKFRVLRVLREQLLMHIIYELLDNREIRIYLHQSVRESLEIYHVLVQKTKCVDLKSLLPKIVQ